MTFIIWFLTAVLVVDCALLVLLILLQLPKKEAGAGIAFGGAATDALFGAGSGNVLTRITKHATIVFFASALVLAFLTARSARTRSSLHEELMKKGPAPAAATAPAPSQSGGLIPPVTPAAPAAPAPEKK